MVELHRNQLTIMKESDYDFDPQIMFILLN